LVPTLLGREAGAATLPIRWVGRRWPCHRRLRRHPVRSTGL